ncbi:centrosome and spindle pole-associated protein 1 isoform X2, partial [Clarias magur]
PLALVQTRATNKRNMTEFATGLMIGAAEAEEAVQKRKERYRQELLEQIAEQRRNRKKEKELELKVAATGVIDPEKEPYRIKQPVSARREHDGRRRDVLYKPRMGIDTPRADEYKKTQDVEREPPERPRMAFQSPVLEYSAALGQLGNTGVGDSGLTAFSENFHKDLSGDIGEMVSPRPSSHHGISSSGIGAYPSDRHHCPKEPVESYRDALKQQIEERKERRRREREENERYEAKVEAEMKASEPWGRGGAGAPLRDDRGNLIISPFTQPSPYARGNVFRELPTPQQLSEQKRYKESLKQQIEEKRRMEVDRTKELRREEKKQQEERKKIECRHRTNVEAYVYPESRNRSAIASPDWNGDTPRPEDKDSCLHRISDDEVSSFTRPSPYARGNVFRELLTSQQLLQQTRYRESLKQQIEEKRRIEVEGRARLKLEAEKEKRLAEDTTHKQKQFEEEQEKKRRKEMEQQQQNARNQELIQQADEQRREAEKKKNYVMKQQYEQLGIYISPRQHSGDSQRSATASPQNARNQELICQAEERRREAEKKRKEEEEEMANEALRQQYEQERKARLEQEFRTRSPPIPTIQKRLGIQIASRPLSSDSQRSATASSQKRLIWQAVEGCKEAENMNKEEDEKENDGLKQQYEQERRVRLEQEFRTRSPPIPTIQKQLGIKISPRPPSGDSQQSATASSQNARNQELIRQADELEAEKKGKEEAEKANNALKQQYEQERKVRLEQEFRTSSPPIPTIQKRLGIQISSRPPSGDCQRSATASSNRSIPTPQSPPVPAQRNQIRAADYVDLPRSLLLVRRNIPCIRKCFFLTPSLLPAHRVSTTTAWLRPRTTEMPKKLMAS